MSRRSVALSAAALTAWAFLPVVLLAAVWQDGGVLSGADGALPGSDQLFYLSVARESGGHGLWGDRFDLGAVDRVGLNPLYLVSGLAWQAGLDLRWAVWLWKPVAALVLVSGFAAYVARMEAGRAARLAAFALALLAFSPLVAALDWAGALDRFPRRLLSLLVAGELMPAWQLWGYVHTALAVGFVPVVLLAAERGLQPGARRALALAAGAGALVALLHPWQGLTLALVLTGAAVWTGERRRALRLAVPLAAIAVPLLYLFVLSQTVPAWEAFARQNEVARFQVTYLAAGFAPLGAFALLGAWRRPRDTGERMLVLWPLAGLVVYAVVANARYHAFQGLSLPLAILAVRGWRRLSLPAPAAVAAVALMVLPGLVYAVDTFRRSVEVEGAPYVLRAGEADALRHLEARRGAGGVLAPEYLGGAVPGWTGRGTWVGHFAWTPDYFARRDATEALFAGRLAPTDARAYVERVGARFLLADCRHRAELRAVVGRASIRRFGCATVYELRR